MRRLEDTYVKNKSTQSVECISLDRHVASLAFFEAIVWKKLFLRWNIMRVHVILGQNEYKNTFDFKDSRSRENIYYR